MRRPGEAGYGPGRFDHPSGVAIGPQGCIYIADTDNDRVQVLSRAGKPMLSWGISYYP